MLLGSNVPTSLARLLTFFRPLFTTPTYFTFSALVAGFFARVGEHNVCGMLAGAGLTRLWHHSRAHRFFSHRRWSSERLGLQLARLIVQLLLPGDAPLRLAVDDTLFRRSGPKVFGARWYHDSSPSGPATIGYGNCFIVVGIIVSLPFCSRPVCLPVLHYLWQHGPKVAVACRLVCLLADCFPERQVHVVADGAFVSRDLRTLPNRITWTAQPRKNAAFHELPPLRVPHRRGRPRRKGDPLPAMLTMAAALSWQRTTVTRYGSQASVEIADRVLLWYLPFGTRRVRLILIRRIGRAGFDTAIVSSDLDAAPLALVERYASRWSIETAFEEAKHVTGVGEARNRVEHAVRRTTPFGLFCQSLLTLWYATSLHADDVVSERRRLAPWYRTKSAPATADMLAMARRVLIAAQFQATCVGAPSALEIRQVQRAWAMAAA